MPAHCGLILRAPSWCYTECASRSVLGLSLLCFFAVCTATPLSVCPYALAWQDVDNSPAASSSWSKGENSP